MRIITGGHVQKSAGKRGWSHTGHLLNNPQRCAKCVAFSATTFASLAIASTQHRRTQLKPSHSPAYRDQKRAYRDQKRQKNNCTQQMRHMDRHGIRRASKARHTTADSDRIAAFELLSLYFKPNQLGPIFRFGVPPKTEPTVSIFT